MECLWWKGDEQKLEFLPHKQQDDEKKLENLQVLVQVAYSGVCGSDFAYMKGNMGEHNAKQDGVILGHEFSGTIVQIGDGVKDFKVGDRVVVDPNSSCHGDSDGCTNDDDANPQFCERNFAIGVKQDGGWAQRCRVPTKQVYTIPDDLPLDVAALCEPFSCVLRGWQRIGDVPNSGRVLIQGAGIIGILFSLLLRHHGFGDVTIAEINESRRRSVRKCLPGSYTVADPSDVTEGFHLIIDCTGNTRVFQKNIELAARGAVILAFGCCPAGSKIEVEPFQVYWKELKILGSFLNPRCFPEAIRLLHEINSNGWIELDGMGVEKFPLRHHDRALTRLKRGEASKIFFEI